MYFWSKTTSPKNLETFLDKLVAPEYAYTFSIFFIVTVLL